jgi:hypothetical protein
MLRRLEKLREDGTAREARTLPEVQTAWKRLTGWIAVAYAEAKRRAEQMGEEPHGKASIAAASQGSGKPKAALPGAIGKRARVVIATDAAGWFMQALGQGQIPAEVEAYRWLLEEFRVSSFAQELGTATPASAKRVQDAWERVK